MRYLIGKIFTEMSLHDEYLMEIGNIFLKEEGRISFTD